MSSTIKKLGVVAGMFLASTALQSGTGASDPFNGMLLPEEYLVRVRDYNLVYRDLAVFCGDAQMAAYFGGRASVFSELLDELRKNF